MFKKLFILSIVSAILFSVFSLSSFARETNIKPGLWKITTKIKIPNLPPGITIPNNSYTSNICIQKEDDIIRGSDMYRKNNACKIIKNKTTGNKFQFEYKCKDSKGQISTIKGNFKYQKNFFNGDMIMIGSDGQRFEQKMSGKRIGDCK